MFLLSVNVQRLVSIVMTLSFGGECQAATAGLGKITAAEREKILEQREKEWNEFQRTHNETGNGNVLKQGCQCGVPFTKIINGVESIPHSHPWMVALYAFSSFTCGGAIINDFYVLTAAHCTVQYTASDLSGKLGEHNIDDNSDDNTVQIVTFSQVTEHPGYDWGTQDNDYSILRTQSQIVFTQAILPICLPPANLAFFGQIVTIVGWGDTTKLSSVLLEQTVKAISRKACGTKFGYSQSEITKSMFCALKKNVDTCQGDSGGPVEYETGGVVVQVGITSWGIGCALKDYPGVYSNVVRQITWILEETSSGNFCS